MYLAHFELLFLFSVSEGRRAAGVAAVWVARNRFAVLDKQQNVRIPLTVLMAK